MFGDPNWTQLLHICCFALHPGCLRQNVSRFIYIGTVVKSLRLIDIMVKVLQHSCLLHLNNIHIYIIYTNKSLYVVYKHVCSEYIVIHLPLSFV